jgi:hypothetical protein
MSALMCWTSVADATARFASPGGSLEACTSTNPCNIVTAIKKAAPLDDITIEPGTYEPTEVLFDEGRTLTIHGLAGSPRPVIIGKTGGMVLTGANTSVRDLEIDVSTPNQPALVVAGFGATAERLLLHALGSEDIACEAGEKVTLSDSVCVADGIKSDAFLFAVSNTTQTTLRNDTLEAPGGSGTLGSVAVKARAFNGHEVQVTLINTIAHGSKADLLAEADSVAGSDGVIIAEHSNYATDEVKAEGAGTGSATPQGSGTNETAPPLFANAGMDDFHELAGSPTIGAGFSSPANGLTDLDGVARQLGGVTDIGAYQFVAPPVSPTAPTTTLSTPTPGVTPPAPVAPEDSQPVLSSRTFAALARGASISRAARGTTVTYTDTQAATTTFTVERALGAGVLSHGRCVAPPRGKPAHGRRCARVSTIGSFGHADVAGANRFRFSGRLRGRALVPGSYELVSAPANSAGLKGATHVNSFKVVNG